MARKEPEPKEVPALDPNTHRMILQFLNTVRCHEDLTVMPRRVIKVDEPRGNRGPDPHDVLERRHGIEEPLPLLDPEDAERLLRARHEASPLYGFGHLRKVADVLSPKVFRKLWQVLSTHFGPATRAPSIGWCSSGPWQ